MNRRHNPLVILCDREDRVVGVGVRVDSAVAANELVEVVEVVELVERNLVKNSLDGICQTGM